MKKVTLLLASFLLVLPFATTLGAPPSSFEQVLDLIDHQRAGDDINVRVRVGTATFGVYRQESKGIDKKTFDQLLASKPLGDLELEFRPEGLAAVHEVTTTLSVGEILAGGAGPNHAQSWFKNVSVRVGSFPIGDWSDFLRAALGHGLVACEALQEGKFALIDLEFKGTGPSTVRFSQGSLALSESFYDHLKLSERFKPASGSNGFAILVHDPHSSVGGAMELVPGLKSLTSANPNAGFVFLVEGRYDPGLGRKIDLGTLRELFDRVPDQAVAHGLAHDLLSRYMIDSATAYRLLYDRKLEAIAIDDDGHLGTTSPSANLDLAQIADAIHKLDEAVSKLALPNTPENQKAKDSIRQTLGIATLYSDANLEGANDQTLVEYYQNMSELLKNLADLGQGLQGAAPSLQIKPVIDELRTQSKACDWERGEYSDAIQRNVTMGKYIADYARKSGQRVPIAFIGSFHTYGITNQLRSQNIGYVVVEPHFGYTTEQELLRFDKALYGDTRASYLRTQANIHKLDVIPTTDEVRTYYAPYLDRRLRQTNDLDNTLKQLTAVPSGVLEYNRFRNALRQNRLLSTAQVEFGGGGNGTKPPVGFSGSFAFFEPGGPNQNGRFVVIDRNDRGWQSDARYRYLTEAVLALPVPEVGNKRKFIYYYDRESRTSFAAFFEPSSKRSYLFEGDANVELALAQMAVLKPAKTQDTNVRVLITELLKAIWSRTNG